MSRRQSPPSPLAVILGILLVLVLLAGTFGVRLLMTGGDWGCVFSKDPQICEALK